MPLAQNLSEAQNEDESAPGSFPVGIVASTLRRNPCDRINGIGAVGRGFG